MIDDITRRKRTATTNDEPRHEPLMPSLDIAPPVVVQSKSPLSHERATQKKHKKFESWRSVFTTVAILLLAPVFALVLTAYVFQTYQVDGPSMETTLQSNDRLVVWKVQRTWSRITGNPFIPARGDIIVFTEPRLGQFGQPPSKQLIKRVIALPGERVVIEDGVLKVYNNEHPQGFQPDKSFLEESVVGSTIDTLDTVVPPDHIFVVGDNRTNSLDSRSFGPVHTNNIVGKLVLRILPLNNFKVF